MRSIYSRFDPARLDKERRFEQVKRVWNHLLLLANGDAEQALRWLDQVDRRMKLFDEGFTRAEFLRRLEERGLVEKDRAGMLRIAPGGELALRKDALERMFSALQTGAEGSHRTRGAGPGHERLSETRPFAFGDDPGRIDFSRSLHNSIRRTGLELDLQERDLETFETEALASCATVIAIDVSHSMTLYGEDRITPAKQVALALVELIRTRYPKDEVSVVLFGDTAQEVLLSRIPYVTNGPFHTNTRDGLRLAARILAKKHHPNRQILLITDGKPSALTEDDGSIYKNPFGLDERVVNRTLEEAAVLRRRGIVVTTFMLTDDPYLVRFVEDFTRTNKGRAYFAAADRLGSFLLVDYIRNRKSRV